MNKAISILKEDLNWMEQKHRNTKNDIQFKRELTKLSKGMRRTINLLEGKSIKFDLLQKKGAINAKKIRMIDKTAEDDAKKIKT